MQKTRLTQNNKAKHTSNAHTKTRRREREEVTESLKALMFFSNLNGFNSSPSPLDQGFAKRKGSSNVWKEKDSK